MCGNAAGSFSAAATLAAKCLRTFSLGLCQLVCKTNHAVNTQLLISNLDDSCCS